MPTVEAPLRDVIGDTGDGPRRTRIEGERAKSAGEIVGVIFGAPEMEGASTEEQYAFLGKILNEPEGEIPAVRRGPVFQAPPDPQAQAEARLFRPTPPVAATLPAASPAGSEEFDADVDLYDPESYRTEPYQLHNGKWVRVHPTSFDERLEISKRVLADLKRGGYLEAAETREEAEQRKLDWRSASVAFTCLHQALRCARRGGPRSGQEPAAAPAFQEKHLPALRQNPGWGSDLEAIAALSNQLSEGRTEAEHLKEMLTDFFGQMESTLVISCSRLKTPYSAETPMPEAVSEVCELLEDFASSVSALRRPGRPFGNRELQQLAMVFGIAAAE